jgi:hypothetical protein
MNLFVRDMPFRLDILVTSFKFSQIISDSKTEGDITSVLQ